MTRLTVKRELTANARTVESATITTVPGPRILVTRLPHQASALADRLRELGAEPILIPTIETVEPTTFDPLDRALSNLSTFHWLLFTSANAVEAFASRLQENAQAYPVARNILNGTGFSPSVQEPEKKGTLAPEGTSQLQIAVIGSSTAKALNAIGLQANLVPPKAVAESLTEALLPHVSQPDRSPSRFLLIRAEEAREHLPETLRAAGAEVTVAPAYRTVIPEGAADQLRKLFAESRVNAITFTSSSTARNLFALIKAGNLTLLPETIRVSIGPITSATLTELGFPPHVESPEATVESLAVTLVKYLRTREQG